MEADWKRAGHVVNVLFRHGLGYFVHALGLKWHLPFFKKLTPAGTPPKDLPVRLRKIMEELGGAYVKLGQFLALRPDLLPAAYCDEFKKLLDEIHPMQFTKVQHVIETSLKAPLKAFFTHIDQKPIGSASVAQVHRAKLKNGKEVVVKVQRPEAKEQFAADISIMYYIAHKIQKRFADKAAPTAVGWSSLTTFVKAAPTSSAGPQTPLGLRTISPLTIVKEFERYTAQELNFVLEARNIDRFSKHFKGSRSVVIPGVYWPATTNQLLTMDYLEGTKLTELLKNKRGAQTAIVQHIADAAFEQMLRLGAFHADLHPGNILVLPDNRIGLLDFGIVGNLSEELIKQTVTIYAALVNKDAITVTKVLLNVGVPAPDADIEDLKLDAERIVNEWYGTDIGQTRVTNMMQALFESAVAHRVAMPVNFILLGKALVTVEGTCLALDPQFNFVAYSQPKIAQLLKEQRHPKAVLKQFTKLSKEYATLLAELPQQASAVIERIKRGAIDFNLRETDVKHIGMDLNRSSNRLSYAMIIAALLVAGALLVNVPPKIGTYSVFTVIGLFFAACLLMMLLVSVLREGNPPFDPHLEGRRKLL